MTHAEADGNQPHRKVRSTSVCTRSSMRKCCEQRRAFQDPSGGGECPPKATLATSPPSRRPHRSTPLLRDYQSPSYTSCSAALAASCHPAPCHHHLRTQHTVTLGKMGGWQAPCCTAATAQDDCASVRRHACKSAPVSLPRSKTGTCAGVTGTCAGGHTERLCGVLCRDSSLLNQRIAPPVQIRL